MAIRTTFTAGEVLTAADLTDTFGAKANLASPTFTGTPAGPTAAAGTNTTQLATTAFAQSAGGLVLTGSATFSAVSSVSVNNCFSATYQNYRIIINSTSSANGVIVARLRVGGVDASGTNYSTQRAQFLGTTSSPARFVSETFARIGLGDANVGQNLTTVDVANPFSTSSSVFLSQAYDNGDSSNAQLALWGATHSLSTSYDGITIYNASGTITGTIRIYGYKNS